MPRNLTDLINEAKGLGIVLEGKLTRDQIMDNIAVVKSRLNPDQKPPIPTVYPMLAMNAKDLSSEKFDELMEDTNWTAEPKLDGMRGLIHFYKGELRITSRRRSDLTYRLSEFGDNLQHLVLAAV